MSSSISENEYHHHFFCFHYKLLSLDCKQDIKITQPSSEANSLFRSPRHSVVSTTVHECMECMSMNAFSLFQSPMNVKESMHVVYCTRLDVKSKSVSMWCSTRLITKSRSVVYMCNVCGCVGHLDKGYEERGSLEVLFLQYPGIAGW